MKNEDECFLLRKAQNTECVFVYDGFFDPMKLRFGLRIDRIYLRYGYAIVFNKSIKFLLVVIVMDFTICTKRHFNCIIF